MSKSKAWAGCVPSKGSGGGWGGRDFLPLPAPWLPESECPLVEGVPPQCLCLSSCASLRVFSSCSEPAPL